MFPNVTEAVDRIVKAIGHLVRAVEGNSAAIERHTAALDRATADRVAEMARDRRKEGRPLMLERLAFRERQNSDGSVRYFFQFERAASEFASECNRLFSEYLTPWKAVAVEDGQLWAVDLQSANAE